MNNRFESNKEILANIAMAVAKYPDMRFGQILVYLNLLPKEEHDTPDGVFTKFADPFYEESTATLQRMKKESVNNI